jgi:hypothetical protein
VRAILLLGSAGLLLATGAVIALSNAAPAPAAPGGDPVATVSVPLELRAGRPDEVETGRLVFRGGIAITAEDERFGGLSALRINADGTRFAAVTDLGDWVTGGIVADGHGWLTGVRDVRLGDLLDKDGKPLEGKTEGDSEGLAFSDEAALSGDAYVSFEGHHRILELAGGFQGKGEKIAVPPAIKDLALNNGLEVLERLPDGRLLAIAEDSNPEGSDAPGWIIDPATGTAIRFSVKKNPPYQETDAAVLPDGSAVLLLERRFAPVGGPGAMLRLIPMTAFVEGASVDGPAVGTLYGGLTVDNMEGICAIRGPKGETFVFLVSDDNFNRTTQRTMLMKFELR